MGHKKPETGILEVETGCVIAGRKEVKNIESDEAYRSRIAEHKELSKFESVRKPVCTMVWKNKYLRSRLTEFDKVTNEIAPQVTEGTQIIRLSVAPDQFGQLRVPSRVP